LSSAHPAALCQGISEGDQDGSIGETFADASGVGKCSSRVESPEFVRNRRRFCVSVGAQQGKEATRPQRGAETNDPAGVREARNHGCGLAYISALGGQHFGRYGRASADHPRLLAPQQPDLTNQYLQATSNIKRLAQGKLVDAIVPSGSLSASKTSPIQ
jgi:hypothetical protein